MILLSNQIKKEVKKGNILIEPFNKKHLAVNSYDVTLNNELLTYIPVKIIKNSYGNVVEKDIDKIKKLNNQYKNDVYIDAAKDNNVFKIKIPEEGLILNPNILYIGSTNEKAGSDKFVPMYEGRSSMARLGLESHISAGFGDLNFQSNWTLEITTKHYLKIYPNMRIGQVFFYKVSKKWRKKAVKKGIVYKGKYLEQTGPQSSKSFIDFKGK